MDVGFHCLTKDAWLDVVRKVSCRAKQALRQACQGFREVVDVDTASLTLRYLDDFHHCSLARFSCCNKVVIKLYYGDAPERQHDVFHFLTHNVKHLQYLLYLEFKAPSLSLLALGVLPLCCPNLQSLTLVIRALDQAGVWLLQKLPCLSSLNLDFSDIEGDPQVVCGALAELTGLTHLSFCSRLPHPVDTAFAAVAQLTCLHTLEFSSWSHLMLQGEALTFPRSLAKLQLQKLQVSNISGVVQSLSACPFLQELYLDIDIPVGISPTDSFVQLTALTRLDLQVQLSHDSPILTSLPKLQHLRVTNVLWERDAHELLFRPMDQQHIPTYKLTRLDITGRFDLKYSSPKDGCQPVLLLLSAPHLQHLTIGSQAMMTEGLCNTRMPEVPHATLHSAHIQWLSDFADGLRYLCQLLSGVRKLHLCLKGCEDEDALTALLEMPHLSALQLSEAETPSHEFWLVLYQLTTLRRLVLVNCDIPRGDVAVLAQRLPRLGRLHVACCCDVRKNECLQVQEMAQCPWLNVTWSDRRDIQEIEGIMQD